jgi:hypothetical protein
MEFEKFDTCRGHLPSLGGNSSRQGARSVGMRGCEKMWIAAVMGWREVGDFKG